MFESKRKITRKTLILHPSKIFMKPNLVRLLALAAFTLTFISILSSSIFYPNTTSTIDETIFVVPTSPSQPTRQQLNKTPSSGHISTFTSSPPPSSSSFDPSLRGQFKLDIRTSETFLGTTVSYSDLIFNNFSTLCNHGPGSVRCSRRSLRSRSCCSCSWTPLARSCSGPFNQTNLQLMRRVLFSHYVHSPTSHQLPQLKQLGQFACPMFDKGTWNLPENFLDLSIEDAAKASLLASSVLFNHKSNKKDVSEGGIRSDDTSIRRDEIEEEKKNRKNIGPLLVWKLGRELRSIKSHTGVWIRSQNNITNTNKNNSDDSSVSNSSNGETSYSSQQQSSTTTINTSSFSSSVNSTKIPFKSPGMLIISGDSMIRQLFIRLIHAIRSKECKTENEMFRGGVFERYFHLSAGYVVTTKGDALELGLDSGCERIAREPFESTLVQGGGRVLLRICYVWDPKNDPREQGREGTISVISSLAKLTAVSGVIYWPTIHGCTTETGECGDANVSNAAAFHVFATAMQHHVPRVVVSSSVMRHWYPFYHWDKVKERNRQLKSYFPVNVFDRVKRFLDDDGILRHWRSSRRRREKWVKNYDNVMNELMVLHHNTVNLSKASAKDNLKEFADVDDTSTSSESVIDPIEQFLYFSTANGKFRFYDHGARHKQVAPRQCDHGHSMCMFWPHRVSRGRSREPVNGMSGICPNGSRCEDPWNFLFIHELLALLMA